MEKLMTFKLEIDRETFDDMVALMKKMGWVNSRMGKKDMDRIWDWLVDPDGLEKTHKAVSVDAMSLNITLLSSLIELASEHIK